MSPRPDLPYDHVRAYYDARLRAPGRAYREAFAEILTDWRLGRASQPADFSAAAAIFQAGVAEIAALRLVAAYNPIFKALQNIENRFAILARVRDDPYAPPRSLPGVQPRLIETRYLSGP